MNRHLRFVFLLVTLMSLLGAVKGEGVLVSEQLQKEVRTKIATRVWADTNVIRMRNVVEPYVCRYRVRAEYDPAWLSSRYIMYREKGKRYTHCEADESGTQLKRLYGEAPVPTIRYSNLEYPETPNGIPYVLPTIDQIPPSLKGDSIMMLNPDTREMENVPLAGVVNELNGQINTVALKSAILYWITGEEEYGHLAADIFQQWSLAVYHQMPVDSCAKAGYFSVESVADIAYRDILLAYDFIRPYFKQYRYSTTHHQAVFERFAENIIRRGAANNNWSALTSSSLVFAAMNIEDAAKKKHYLDLFLSRDTVVGKIGHLSLKTLTEKFFTPDGLWKETPSDQNRCLHELLIAALACENNGYEVFKRFPVLINAAHVAMASAFPDGTLPNLGDTGREYPFFSNIIMAQAAARQINHPSETSLASAAWELLSKNQPRDRDGYWINLLYGRNLLAEKSPDYQWQSSGRIDHTRYFYLRNGDDRTNALMLGIRGATYMHNHCDALGIEFYGKGMVMGIDPGMGTSLNDPLHIEYYSQWAAHNTVIPAGSAVSDRLYKGGDAQKSIGQIEIVYQYPNNGVPSKAGMYSYQQARYFERYTKTMQNRTSGIVRLSADAGYYFDIFHSNNPLLNDYLYHNVGDTLRLMNFRREPLRVIEEEMVTVTPDFPGLRYITNTKTPGDYRDGVVAEWEMNLPDRRKGYMQALMPAASDRFYYAGLAPASTTSTEEYQNRMTPTLVVRQIGEAQTRPFGCIFEPYAEGEQRMVQSVEWIEKSSSKEFTGLRVRLTNGNSQVLLVNMTPSAEYRDTLVTFKGDFLAYDYEGEVLKSVFASNVESLTIDGVTLRKKDAQFNVTITFANGKMLFKTDVPTAFYHYGSYRSLTIEQGGSSSKLNAPKRRSRRSPMPLLSLPVLDQATLQVAR